MYGGYKLGYEVHSPIRHWQLKRSSKNKIFDDFPCSTKIFDDFILLPDYDLDPTYDKTMCKSS